MFIDLNKMEAGERRIDGALAIPDLEGPSGEPIPVTGASLTGHIRKGKHGFDLDAELGGTTRLLCSRCLTPFEAPVTSKFHLRLVPVSAEDPAAARDESGDEDVDVLICPEGKVDLVEAASEQIYLNLPLKPVCRPGCKGLCPQCGVDRNEHECACASQATDPRWTPLEQLKNRRVD
jgi:uncharacterized protein